MQPATGVSIANNGMQPATITGESTANDRCMHSMIIMVKGWKDTSPAGYLIHMTGSLEMFSKTWSLVTHICKREGGRLLEKLVKRNILQSRYHEVERCRSASAQFNNTTI